MPLGRYSAFCIIVWGTILACFAAVHNFPGAVAIRFFLGMFEAAVTPGFALLTSQVSCPIDCALSTTLTSELIANDAVVHEARAGKSRRHLVQFQRLGSDLRRICCVRSRSWDAETRRRHRALEDYLPRYRFADRCPRGIFLLSDPGQPAECALAQGRRSGPRRCAGPCQPAGNRKQALQDVPAEGGLDGSNDVGILFLCSARRYSQRRHHQLFQSNGNPFPSSFTRLSTDLIVVDRQLRLH